MSPCPSQKGELCAQEAVRRLNNFRLVAAQKFPYLIMKLATLVLTKTKDCGVGSKPGYLAICSVIATPTVCRLQEVGNARKQQSLSDKLKCMGTSDRT